ncbi:transposase InsO family protein [Luteimonas sp. RC10]|nr:transposase InsO family protein [Luteimonas sp. RC10]
MVDTFKLGISVRWERAMPWQEVSTMTLREEFTRLALREDTNLRQLCRRFGISPTTGYKWRARARLGEPLSDRSRRPQATPLRCAPQVEALIVGLRAQHPAWGARKLARRLEVLGHAMPAVSTVHAVLRRHGLIAPAASQAAQPWQRFEHPAPNDLWQMDFKGHVPMSRGRCHPLTVLDDHSRYALVLQACGEETRETVIGHLTTAFRRYGVPLRMTMDNGAPWGTHYTRLDLWLMRQGIRVGHSRPFHPQTQGKDERFHRTLKIEVLQHMPLIDLAQAQRAFDGWRAIYNQQRPHEALGMGVPVDRYRPSARDYVEHPAPPEYGDSDEVRLVHEHGRIAWRGRNWKVGKAFVGERVAIRPTLEDGRYEVYWSTCRVARIDLVTGQVNAGRVLA